MKPNPRLDKAFVPEGKKRDFLYKFLLVAENCFSWHKKLLQKTVRRATILADFKRPEDICNLNQKFVILRDHS